MDIVLVPGLWLDGNSWEAVSRRLESAGHRPRPITLPGMESIETNRTHVTLAACVASIIEGIDAAGAKVVLVGHSAGAGLAHAAADARVDRIESIFYVGGFPAVVGVPLADGFPTDGGDLPMPAWSDFDEADLRDLDEAALERLGAMAIPSPASFATDVVELSDQRRYAIPATVVCPEFTAEMLRGWVAQDLGPVRELARMQKVEYVDLPTGHWPQFTRPADLAAVIIDRVERAR